MAEFEYPTEVVELPSQGWFYSKENPLSSGKVEMKYMTAKEEDILTSRNLIMKGVVLDKLLEALIVSPDVKYDDLLLGDKNALLVAARIMGYGKEYATEITCPNPECGKLIEHSANLEEFAEEDFDFSKFPKNVNEFSFTLPLTKRIVKFKILTHADERKIEIELEKLKKITDSDFEITVRMRHSIVSVDGETDRTKIKDFVDNIPARDARAFRNYARTVMPNVDFSINFTCPKCDHSERVEVALDNTFFWPDSRI